MLLTPIQTRELFLEALEKRFAVLAVNADSPAAIVDVLEAARQCDAPVIIETSLWQLTGHSFGFGDPILGLRQYLSYLRTLAESERYAHLRVAFHTDHIKGPRTLEILTEAHRLGASSLSLDSSELTEEENLALARQLCDLSESLTLELEAGVDDGLTPLDVTDRIVGGIEHTHPGRFGHRAVERGMASLQRASPSSQPRMSPRTSGVQVSLLVVLLALPYTAPVGSARTHYTSR